MSLYVERIRSTLSDDFQKLERFVPESGTHQEIVNELARLAY